MEGITEPEEVAPSVSKEKRRSTYANALSLYAGNRDLAINFRLEVPPSTPDGPAESVSVATVWLSWDTAEGLLEVLKKGFQDRPKAKPPVAKGEKAV